MTHAVECDLLAGSVKANNVKNDVTVVKNAAGTIGVGHKKFILQLEGLVLYTEVRDAVCMAFMILMMLSAIAMIVIVMMQKGTNESVGAITGVSDTYFGKNKERSKESILKIVTYVLFAFILVCALIYCIIRFVA